VLRNFIYFLILKKKTLFKYKCFTILEGKNAHFSHTHTYVSNEIFSRFATQQKVDRIESKDSSSLYLQYKFQTLT